MLCDECFAVRRGPLSMKSLGRCSLMLNVCVLLRSVVLICKVPGQRTATWRQTVGALPAAGPNCELRRLKGFKEDECHRSEYFNNIGS